jgi:hypothetical protein
MNRTATVALALSAGLMGGLFARYIGPDAVHAQAQTPAPKEIRAQSFVLVNDQGVAFGLMGFDPQGHPIIKLVGESGHTIWSTGPMSVLRLP